MSDVAIRVEGLSKRYRRWLPSGQDRLSEVVSNLARGLVEWPLHRLRRRPDAAEEPTADASRGEFWALKDVSFEVKRGEVVGIIGRNGAGKSTLLKILSRITEPTAGRFGVRGRVGSLLEVGTGFHPELTGRENVYLSGSLLGMSRAEVRRKFDEIAAFAEVDDFLDTPVKRYSSGMQTRLGFAVAAHLQPEVLIVDEVLAVGDASFQKKCLGKMGEVAREGRTVLFVSHNMTAIKSLCQHVILLNHGKVDELGSASELVARYMNGDVAQTRTRQWDVTDAPGTSAAKLIHAAVRMVETNGVAGHFTVATSLRLSFTFAHEIRRGTLNFSVVVYEAERGCIFNTGSEAVSAEDHPGQISGAFVIPGHFLNDGFYSIRVLLVQDTSVALCDLNDVLIFQVDDVERPGNWYGKWIGAVRPRLEWSVPPGRPSCATSQTELATKGG